MVNGALEAALNEERVRDIVGYLARRLACDEGEQRMTFSLSGGNLRRTDLGRGPIRNEELEAIAGWQAVQQPELGPAAGIDPSID